MFSSFDDRDWVAFTGVVLGLFGALYYVILAFKDHRDAQDDPVARARTKSDVRAAILCLVPAILGAASFFFDFKAQQKTEEHLATNDAQIAQLSPSNQPVADISAHVAIIFDRTNELADTTWQPPAYALMSLGIGSGSLTKTANLDMLVSSDITPSLTDDHPTLLFEFRSGFEDNPVIDKYPPLSVAQTLERMQEVRLWLVSVPSYIGVLHGKVRVLLNGSTSREFEILAKPGYRGKFGRNRPLEIEATNILANSSQPFAK